ncbi:MAG: DUF3737 family protein [Ruminococcaceae bacterium]|nr:DUF3737 family protein [Oscillospiraceae bacterium]
MKNFINSKNYDEERALYGIRDTEVFSCTFEGEADGESALKESSSVKLHNCRFALRYPLWHATDFSLHDCSMTDTCRAPMWYSKIGTLRHCRILGVKAIRECNDILIEDSVISSEEFGWRCKDIKVRNTFITSEYFLFETKGGVISELTLEGKYSFQYVEDIEIFNSHLDTKDAFWHAKNVTVTDSIINGEYLGWYSEGLTLINCRISGTQPFCYCKNLKLVNCTMENTDLAFEYSEVEADINGHILSVKNPLSGRICADSIGEIITEGSVRENNCKIQVKTGGII